MLLSDTIILLIARQEGLKFNPEKIQLAKNEIEYLGQVVTNHGTRPDDKKVNAIREYPEPSNRDELHRILSIWFSIIRNICQIFPINHIYFVSY